MSRSAQSQPPSKALLLLEGRSIGELAAFAAAYPILSMAPKGDGHPVLVLPGLGVTDFSTRPLRRFLEQQGYAAHGWKLGRNRGPVPGLETSLMERLDDLHARYEQPVSLIGWSLGGVYARQMAKLKPDQVRHVITLGSPFAGGPETTNGRILYELASGQKADAAKNFMGGDFAKNPRLPTTAIFSRSDGVCAWRSCVTDEGPLAENIEVWGSHCGLGHNPAVVYAIADRLSAKTFVPFSPQGWKAAFFPRVENRVLAA